MKLWFLNRGYPRWLINQEVEKVKFPCTSRKKDTKMKGIPLIITYHSLLKDFASMIRKHLYILYLSKEVKKIFTPGPMVSFRGARKLGSCLVRAKLYPLERSVGSLKCNGKRCQVCLYFTETKTFSSTVTKKEYVINHKFNCNSKCLTYLLTCKKCMLQYLGENVDEFQLRWNNYKMNDRNFFKGQTCMDQHLFEYFASEGHCSFLEDVTIIIIDKTDPKDPN